ncbi:hypothetical protein EOM82_04885 [bacterium]|nr:hypothetical protein [bacterium]
MCPAEAGCVAEGYTTVTVEINAPCSCCYLRIKGQCGVGAGRGLIRGKTVSQLKSNEELIDSELKDFRELYESIIEILQSYSEDSEGVYMEGQSKFLQSPDQDLQTAKDFLTVIDTKEKLKEMVEDNQDIEFCVKIGKDEKGGIDKCAIVTAKYKFKGKELGHAGVIGPERMDYNKVVSVLKYIGTAVEEISSGGDDDEK